jgi:hypothetical protein
MHYLISILFCFFIILHKFFTLLFAPFRRIRNEWENSEMSNKKTGGHTGFLPIFFICFFARASGQGPEFYL